MRHVLVMNNVVLGQRRDPSLTLARSFYDKSYNRGVPDDNGHIWGPVTDKDGNPVKVNDKVVMEIKNTRLTIPSNKAAHGLANAGAALGDINIAGQRAGFAGNLFAFNVIGLRDEVPLFADSKASLWWTNPNVDDSEWNGCADSNKFGIRDLLLGMSLWAFNNYDNAAYDPTKHSWMTNEYTTSGLPMTDMMCRMLPGKLKLMSWSELTPPLDGKSQPTLANVRPNPFSTDFSVALPGIFHSNSLGCRWPSIADLNDPNQDFGAENTTARGLIAPGATSVFGPTAAQILAWPALAAVPTIAQANNKGWNAPSWYPDESMPTNFGKSPMSDPVAWKGGLPDYLAERNGLAQVQWPHAMAYVKNSSDVIGNPLSEFATFRGPFKPNA